MTNETNPLFILPFDHRTSFARDVLGATYPVSSADAALLCTYKEVVFEGFLAAKTAYTGAATLAILVDEEFGSAVLPQAKSLGIPFALTMESSVHEPFGFAYDDLAAAIAKWRPTWAKALVRYTVGNDAANAQTREQLRLLALTCAAQDTGFMLEVLLKGDGSPRDLAVRMMDDMHGDGVSPTLWKIEGLATPEDWHALAPHAKAPMIVLGRGESGAQVDAWLATAGKSGETIGFAVGRTVFLKPIQNLHHGVITREVAAQEIAKNYLHCMHVWASTR